MMYYMVIKIVVYLHGCEQGDLAPSWNLIQILFIKQCFPSKCLIAFDFCFFPVTVKQV